MKSAHPVKKCWTRAEKVRLEKKSWTKSLMLPAKKCLIEAMRVPLERKFLTVAEFLTTVLLVKKFWMKLRALQVKKYSMSQITLMQGKKVQQNLNLNSL